MQSAAVNASTLKVALPASGTRPQRDVLVVDMLDWKLEDESPCCEGRLGERLGIVGAQNKRAHARPRRTAARRDQAVEPERRFNERVEVQDSILPATLTTRRMSYASISRAFTRDEIRRVISSHEHFHPLPGGCATVGKLSTSSAGIAGWSEFESTISVAIGDGKAAQRSLLVRFDGPYAPPYKCSTAC